MEGEVEAHVGGQSELEESLDMIGRGEYKKSQGKWRQVVGWKWNGIRQEKQDIQNLRLQKQDTRNH